MTQAWSLVRHVLPDVRGLPRPFWLLLGVALVDRIGGFVLPYLSIHLTTVAALSVEDAGLVLSSWAVGGLLGSPLGGSLADRLGRRPVLLTSLLSTALMLLVLAEMHGTWRIAAACFALGVAQNLGRPAMASAIADTVPALARRRAFALHYWVINLGFAFAASLAGLLTAVSWRVVFIADATTSVIAAVIVWRKVRETADIAAQDPSGPELPTAERSLLTDTTLWLLIIAGTATACVFQQLTVGLAAAMAEHGLAGSYGALIALNGLLIVVLQPLVLRLVERFRPLRVMAAGSWLIGVGFFLTAFCATRWHFALAIAVWTLGEILHASTVTAVLAALAKKSQRARYQGLYGLCWSASAFAPAAGAMLFQRSGATMLWTTCLLAGAVAAAIELAIDRTPRLKELRVDGAG